MNPIDISRTIEKSIPLKKCHICSRGDCVFDLWTHFYCKKDWESLGCKNCDNCLDKKKAYRGKNDDVFCESCIENNKKASIKYNKTQKPCVKFFNINNLPTELCVTFKCYVCSKTGLNEESYYDVWSHSYCQKCWSGLTCKYRSSHSIDKTKAYKGKDNEIICRSCKGFFRGFGNDISKTEMKKAKVYKCYNCNRQDYEENAVFFDLWSHYYCSKCFEHLGCKSCYNKIDKTQAYRGKNRDVFCEKCITINYKSEEMNTRSRTQVNLAKKSSICVCM